jgi:hypothetical protein
LTSAIKFYHDLGLPVFSQINTAQPTFERPSENCISLQSGIAKTWDKPGGKQLYSCTWSAGKTIGIRALAVPLLSAWVHRDGTPAKPIAELKPWFRQTIHHAVIMAYDEAKSAEILCFVQLGLALPGC